MTGPASFGKGIERGGLFGTPSSPLAQPERTIPTAHPSRPAEVDRRLSGARVGSTPRTDQDGSRNLAANLPTASAGQDSDLPVDQPADQEPPRRHRTVGRSPEHNQTIAATMRSKKRGPLSQEATDNMSAAQTRRHVERRVAYLAQIGANPSVNETERIISPEREERLGRLVDFAQSTRFTNNEIGEMYGLSGGMIGQDMDVLRERGLIPDTSGRQRRYTDQSTTPIREERLGRVLDFVQSTSFTLKEIGQMLGGLSAPSIANDVKELKHRGLIPDEDRRHRKRTPAIHETTRVREERLGQLVDFARNTTFTERELARMYGVSRGTIVQNMREVKNRGLLPDVDVRQVGHRPQKQIPGSTAEAIAARNRASGNARVVEREDRLDQMLPFARNSNFTQGELATMFGISKTQAHNDVKELRRRHLLPDVEGSTTQQRRTTTRVNVEGQQS